MLLIVVDVIATYVPLFYIALCDISQEGLISKEEFGEMQNWPRGRYSRTALNPICTISCTKEPLVMIRIVDILQKSGFTGKEEVMLLKL